jgi:hypothetical protein
MEVRDVNGVDVLACLALSIDVSKYASCGVREERLLIVGLPTQIMPECNHQFEIFSILCRIHGQLSFQPAEISVVEFNHPAWPHYLKLD